MLVLSSTKIVRHCGWESKSGGSASHIPQDQSFTIGKSVWKKLRIEGSSETSYSVLPSSGSSNLVAGRSVMPTLRQELGPENSVVSIHFTKKSPEHIIDDTSENFFLAGWYTCYAKPRINIKSCGGLIQLVASCKDDNPALQLSNTDQRDGGMQLRPEIKKHSWERSLQMFLVRSSQRKILCCCASWLWSCSIYKYLRITKDFFGYSFKLVRAVFGYSFELSLVIL